MTSIALLGWSCRNKLLKLGPQHLLKPSFMDTKDIAATLLKIAGLVLIAFALMQLPSYFPAPLDPNSSWSLPQAFAAAAITVGPIALLGVVLWFFPGSITNKIISGSRTSESLGIVEVETVALTVIGVYLAIHGVVDTVYHVTTLIQFHRLYPGVNLTPAITLGGLVAALTQIVLGAVLALRAKGVVRMLKS